MHTGAERGDDSLNFGVLQYAVDTCAFDIENLSANRQDRLRTRVAPLACRTTGRVALDDEDFARFWVGGLTVDELAGQAPTAEQTLAVAGQIASLARGDARARRLNALADDLFAFSRILLEPLAELVVARRLHEALDLSVAELGLGLALELRIGQLHRDDAGETFAHIFAAQPIFGFLDQAPLFTKLVDESRERGAKTFFVGAALMGVDGVGERMHRLGVARVPLHSQLERHGIGLTRLECDDAAMRRLL